MTILTDMPAGSKPGNRGTNRRHLQRGFTLTEMMISLVISGILLSSISVIVSGAYDYYFEGRNKIQLQQDFSLLEQVLGRKIRASLKGQHKIYSSYSAYQNNQPAGTSGSCLRLGFSSGDSVFFYQDSLDFKIIDATGGTQNFITGVVQNLKFTDQSTSIQTEYSLKKDKLTIADTVYHSFRN